jgi:hypothetical protein
MMRWSRFVAAFVAFATLLGVVVTTLDAMAQSAADRKTQPGSGQCRLSNGQKC